MLNINVIPYSCYVESTANSKETYLQQSCSRRAFFPINKSLYEEHLRRIRVYIYIYVYSYICCIDVTFLDPLARSKCWSPPHRAAPASTESHL